VSQDTSFAPLSDAVIELLIENSGDDLMGLMRACATLARGEALAEAIEACAAVHTEYNTGRSSWDCGVADGAVKCEDAIAKIGEKK
jgi:hypothetical protein